MNNQDQLMDLCFEALFISVSAQLVSIPVSERESRLDMVRYVHCM